MTGPDHYLEAERLLNTTLDSHGDIRYGDSQLTASRLAAAQVHATLALAAATRKAASQGSKAF